MLFDLTVECHLEGLLYGIKYATNLSVTVFMAVLVIT